MVSGSVVLVYECRHCNLRFSPVLDEISTLVSELRNYALDPLERAIADGSGENARIAVRSLVAYSERIRSALLAPLLPKKEGSNTAP